MTFADICRAVAIRCGVPPASGWIGNTDETAREIVEFVREATRFVAEQHPWHALTRPWNAPVLAADEQVVLVPEDWREYVPHTARVGTQAIEGPVSWSEYEQRRRDQGPLCFAMMGRSMCLWRAPVGMLELRYISRAPVMSGGDRHLTWQTDTDTALIDPNLIVLAAVVLWRESKGLDASISASSFASSLSRARAADQNVGVLSMGKARALPQAIVVLS